MNKASSDRLTKVHPHLRTAVEQIISTLSAKGLTIEVVQGLRTYAEQNALYEQGRLRAGLKVTNAKAGQSFHNFGLAVDLCPFKDGKPQWDDHKSFVRIGAESEVLDLEWGGSWTRFVDLPHVQLKTKLTLAECRKIYSVEGLEGVWKAVTPKQWKPEPVKPKYNDPVEFVREFQRVHGLTVDGIAGPKSWAALEK